MDAEINCNLRIGGALAAKFSETGWFIVEQLFLHWMGLGAPGIVNDKVPGVAVSRVSLVDLSGVATRQGGLPSALFRWGLVGLAVISIER
ncbi:hypothetical protein [Parasedimentitalea psychrophila]|uniref:Uncharacterized protein n=1 Tax=Parasedimentitalea psychrophila TaxID=2997337 RepID=A0A9Y2KZK4_9RHOB|nr:hypothetical protein [Parasedimentitalea psychrophila]WIY26006.1 hypothetical protein QPJ95_03485 [Parasedimentitalea psychrophila]